MRNPDSTYAQPQANDKRVPGLLLRNSRRAGAFALGLAWLLCGPRTQAAAPAITTQPAVQTVAVGETATLSVAVSGTGPLAYQWFKNGAMAAGATRSTLSLTNAEAPNSGVYYAVVTNSYGMRISQPVTVTVGSPQLLAWGRNNHGQLGDGTTTNRLFPESAGSNVVAAAAGEAHSLYLKANGTLWAMGNNEYGQLGDGTTNSRATAECVASNAVAVTAGSLYSLYVKGDGTLWAMGDNNNGQLGDGTHINRSSAVSVASNVVAVSGGQEHCLYLKDDGTLWTMGRNYYGQLGDGTDINRSNAVSVASNVVAVAGGGGHSLYLKHDGTLWTMGLNNYGQLGDGTHINRSTAVSVASNVVAVAGGDYHSLYLKADGTLRAMGNNEMMQLGDGTLISRSNAVSVASNVVAVTAGYFHSLYLKADGMLWAMGDNSNGELGDGTTIDKHVSVPGMSLATVVSGCAQHTLAVGLPLPPVITSPPEDQAVMAGTPVIFTVIASGLAPLTYQWLFNGTNISGAGATNYHLASVTLANAGTYAVLVSNSIGSVTSSPAALAVRMSPIITTQPASQQVAAGGTVNLSVAAAGTAPLGYQWLKNGKVIAGATRSSLSLPGTGAANSGVYYVVVTNGSGLIISQPARVAAGSPLLLAWGYNSNGQLGDGTTATALWPEAVDTDVVVAAAGGAHSLYLKSDGTLWGMGWNNRGELGDGTTAQRTRPEALTSNVVAVAAGEHHSLFLRSDGTLWAMGNNGNGQLGNGSTGNQLVPGWVASNVVAMAAGADFSLFLKNDGTLWGMGYNYDGELGDGTTTDRHSPVAVISGTNVVAVTAGAGHTLFLRSDGSLWGIGYNINGELGDGTYVNRSAPIAVQEGSGTVAAAGGANHTLFLRGDGTLWAMGYNVLGELGDGTTSGRSTPETVATNGAAVAAGWYCSLFAKGDGTLWTMGYNSRGGLGNGTMAEEDSPVLLGGISAASVTSCSHGFHALAVGLTLPPEITIPPTNQTVEAGNTVTFSVAASGFGPLSYQWQLDGANFANATNATLTLIGVTAKDAGPYAVIVNSAAGSTGSGAAVLVVNKAEPAVTTWPTATAIICGQTLASSILTGGSASVGGTFAFATPDAAPAPGTVLQPVTFTPDDPASYSPVTGSVSVTVMAMVTVTAYPTNAGTVTGGGAYVVGSNAVLTATAANGWLFASWNDGATDNPYVIAAPPTNCTYAANFAPAATITLVASPGDGGAVTGNGTFPVGSANVISAVASNGWLFTGWSDGVTNNPRAIIVASNRSYTANFVSAAAVTTIASPPAGGCTTGGGLFASGHPVTVSGTASNGWLFLNWNGTFTNYTKTGKNSNPWTFTAASNTTCTANFAQVTNGFVYLVMDTRPPQVEIIGYVGPTDGAITIPSVIAGMPVTVIATGAFTQKTNSTIVVPGSITNIQSGSIAAAVVEFFGATAALWLAADAFESLEELKLVDVAADVAAELMEDLADDEDLSTLKPVKVSADPPEGGTCLGTGFYKAGKSVPIAAKAAEDWSFKAWGDGNALAEREITVSEFDNDYAARFTRNPTVTTQATPEKGGSVTGGGSYKAGDTVTLNAITNSGYRFKSWDNGTLENPYVFTMPDKDITRTATFVEQVQVEAKADPTNGGYVLGAKTYDADSLVTLSAIHDPGWRFNGWFRDGQVSNAPVLITNVPVLITVATPSLDGPVTYTAKFVQTVAVTGLASPTNAGSVSGTGTYDVGDTNVTLTATASNNWHFVSWSDAKTNNPYVLTAPQTALTLTAHFEATATITVGANPGKGGSASGGGTFLVGSRQTISAVASNGWIFLGWSDGTTNNPYHITVPSTNTSYTANFTASNPPNITISLRSNTLILQWPADYAGWILQARADGLGAGLSGGWFDVPGSADTNLAAIPLDPAQPSAFYRLRRP